METLEVDGSQGEGGGQILRSALAFASILRRPVRVSKVRAGREEPGLKRQHLAAVEIIAEVFGGELGGAHVGSTEVSYSPGAEGTSSLKLDMGTAASITLVLQALVPAAALTGRRLTLELVGGTDVPWSPTFDYLVEVARPAYEMAGIRFEAQATSRGYYPRGGGVAKADIFPSESVRALEMTGQAPRAPAKVTSRTSGLPAHVRERQMSSACDYLGSHGIEVGMKRQAEDDSVSPGSSLLVSMVTAGAIMGADSLGAKGRPAEDVGADAARRFEKEWSSGAAFDSHLADMVIPFLALARARSRVSVPSFTPHLESGLRLAKQFTGCTFDVTQGERCVVVEVSPKPGESMDIQHNV